MKNAVRRIVSGLLVVAAAGAVFLPLPGAGADTADLAGGKRPCENGSHCTPVSPV